MIRRGSQHSLGVDGDHQSGLPRGREHAVRHAAHYIASHPPDEDDTAGESSEATTYEDELRELVPIAQEWLIDNGNDPDLLG